MTLSQSLHTLREKKGTLFLAGFFVAAVSFFSVTLFSPRFKVETDFLVVQTNSQTQDFYTLFKSSEYLGKVLSESIWSERFINAVIETGKVNKEVLPLDKRERLKAWRDMVSVERNIDAGMLSVIVKADTERESGKVMQAISDVLITKNVEFRGGDEKAVEIRILSGPITERNPSPKELILIVVVGFFAGVAFMAFRIILRGLTRAY